MSVRNEQLSVFLYKGNSDTPVEYKSNKKYKGRVLRKASRLGKEVTFREFKLKELEYSYENILEEMREEKKSYEEICAFVDEFNERVQKFEDDIYDLMLGFIADELFDGQFTIDEFQDGYADENDYSFQEFLNVAMRFSNGSSIQDIKRDFELSRLEDEVDYQHELESLKNKYKEGSTKDKKSDELIKEEEYDEALKKQN